MLKNFLTPHSVIGADNINEYYDPKLKINRLKELKIQKFKFFKADISDYVQLEKIYQKHKFSGVFNLAAQAGVVFN